MKKLIAVLLAWMLTFGSAAAPFGAAIAEEAELVLAELAEEETIPDIAGEESAPGAAEALSVKVPSSIRVSAGVAELSADCSRSGAVLYWQRVAASAANGCTEAELELLDWQDVAQGERICLSEQTRAECEGWVYRCVAVLGDEIAFSGICRLEAENAEVVAEETVDSAAIDEEPVSETNDSEANDREAPAPEAYETEAIEEPVDDRGAADESIADESTVVEDTEAALETVPELLETELIESVPTVTITAERTENGLKLIADVENAEATAYRWQCNASGTWEQIGIEREIEVEATPASYRCTVAAGELLLVSEEYRFENDEAQTRGDAGLPIERLSFDSNSVTLIEKHTEQLSVIRYPVESGNRALVWSSSDESVARVASDGTVTAGRCGSAVIIVSAKDDASVSAAMLVIVEENPLSLVVNLGGQDSLELAVNQRVSTVKAVVLNDDEDARAVSDNTVRWRSSDSSVVTVDSTTGVMTGVSTGTATVTAYCAEDPTVDRELEVTVVSKKTDLPSRVYVTADSTTLGVGQEAGIRVSFNSGRTDSYSLTTSDPSVVMLTNDGTIIAEGTGKATIKATTFSGRSGSVTITVKEAPSQLFLSADSVELAAGDKAQLTISVDSGAACIGELFSSDSSVAMVSANGTITAIGEGSATITARTYNGLEKTCSVRVVPALSSVRLSAERTTIARGEMLQLSCVTDCELPVSITYKSSSTKYATVDRYGVVTAKANGTVRITATAYNGVSDTITLKVMSAPRSLTLTSSASCVGLGDRAQLKVAYNSGATGACSFLSSDEAVATVDENGVVTTHSTGTVYFRAEAFNGKSAETSIEVVAAPKRVVLDHQSLTICAGDGVTLGYEVDDGAAGTVTWQSADPSIATVDESGRVRGVRQGVTYVTATTYNGVSATCSVNVLAELTELKISAERSVIGKGETLQLTYTSNTDAELGLTWKSSKTKYATVDENGLITAKGLGYTTITATAYNGVQATFSLKVVAAPTSVDLKLDHSPIALGDTATATVTYSKGAGAYRLYAEDPSVIEVGEDGLLYAKRIGSTRIKAIAYNGKYDIIDVDVVKAPTVIAFEQDDLSLCAGDSYANSTETDSEAVCTVNYRSSDPSVATVDENGRITAVAPGTAIICATVPCNGITGDCLVRVYPAVTKIDLIADTKLCKGDTMQIVAIPDTDGAPSLRYQVNNTRYATISSDGLLTAKAVGTVKVTVTTYNGVSASVTIDIVSAPSSVSLTLDRSVIGVGDTTQATVKVSGSAYASYDYEVEDPTIADVSEDGEVIGRAVGKTRIGVKTFNGKWAVCDIEVVAAPTKVILSRSSCSIAAGDTYQLRASMNEGAVGKLTYISLDTSVATVDPDTGVITAIKEGGWGMIRVKAYNGIYANLSLTVTEAVSSIELTAPKSLVAVGEEVQMGLTMNGNANMVSMPTYTVSPSTVGTVSDSGVFTAKAAGTCTITAKSYNGLTSSVELQVGKAPTSVKLVSDLVSIAPGQTTNVSVTLSSGAYSLYTLSVSDPTILNVTQEGVVTGLKDGTAVITATTSNGLTADLSIKVDSSTGDTAVLGVGQTISVVGSIGSGEYTVEPASVGTVSSMGVFTSKAAGICTVTCRTFADGISHSMQIDVRKAPTKVTITASKTSVQVGETAYVTVELDDGAYGSFTFKSSDTSVATISQDGIMTALKAGKTTITVTTYNGVSASGVLTVTAPVSDADQTTAERVISIAKSKLGAPYIYGKAGPDTFDCSGFVLYCYKQGAGISLTHNANKMWGSSSYQKIASRSDLQPGDLIFLDTDGNARDCDHVGIYLGKDSFIHASSAGGKVIVSVLSTYCKYQTFLCGGRYF